MANFTYSFDGGDQAALNTILGRYNGEFRAAVQDAIGSLIPDSDITANANIDFQVMDDDGEDFDTAGYGGAYVGAGTGFVNLDEAPILVFDDAASDGDGVAVTVDGDIDQFAALTTLGDKFVVRASDGDGNLTIDAYKGNDTVTSGRGDDVIYGGDGDDRVNAGGGDDSVEGGQGDDRLSGGAGDDLLEGGSGNDTILGDSGDDEIYGGDGDDSIYGGTGATTVDGGSGFDVAYIKGDVNQYSFEDGAWTAGDNVIENVEYTKLDNGVLITVGSDDQASVARLFQMLTDADPTALQLRNALDLFDAGFGLADVAAQIDAALPADQALNLDEVASGSADIKGFVATLVNNAFDADEWTNAELDSYVQGLIDTYGEDIEKKFIAADLVTQLTDADEHIHIAVSV